MPTMTTDQIAALSVPDLDAAVIAKCKELREVEGRATAGPWKRIDWREGNNIIGIDGITVALQIGHYEWKRNDGDLICLARNSFLAHLDAMEALARWRCGRCEGTGERTMCGSGQLLPCPSCAPIVTIKWEWLGKMMEVGK